MPQPTLNQVHVSVPLTNMSVAYLQRGGFLADTIFPVVPVQNESNKYYKFAADVFRTARAKKRAPGAPPAKGGYSPTTATYTVDRDAYAHAIPDPIRANADAVLNLDRESTEFVTSSLMLTIEANFVSSFWTTGVWTGSSTGSDITPGTTWDDVSSTPIEDVQTQIRAMEQNTGYMPNVLALGRKVYDNLLRHPDIVDLLKGGATTGTPAVANAQLLARIFGVDRVVVARASQNTASEGQAATYGFVAGSTNALLAYAAPSPGIMVPSAGYTFAWMATGNNMGIQVKRYRLPEEQESDQIEVNRWYSHNVVGADLGVFFSGAVAA